MLATFLPNAAGYVLVCLSFTEPHLKLFVKIKPGKQGNSMVSAKILRLFQALFLPSATLDPATVGVA